jgi:hypothetical protein
VYLTYDEYLNMGGSVHDEATYVRLEAKARANLDALTHARLRGETPVRECVKLCMFDLVDALNRESVFAAHEANVGNIASASNDGVSVTYKNRADIERDTKRAMKSAIYLYLADEHKGGVPLLYGGVEYDTVRQ